MDLPENVGESDTMEFNEIRINSGEMPIAITKDWLLHYRKDVSCDEMTRNQKEGKLYTIPLIRAMLMSHYNRTAWNDSESQGKYLDVKNGQITEEMRDISQKLMVDDEGSGRIIMNRKYCIKKLGILGRLSPRWFIFKGTNLAVYHTANEDAHPKLYSLIGAAYEVEDRDSPPHKTPWSSPIEILKEAQVKTEEMYILSSENDDNKVVELKVADKNKKL